MNSILINANLRTLGGAYDSAFDFELSATRENSGGVSIAPGLDGMRVVMLPDAAPLPKGDFSLDAMLDATDIDFLSEQVARGISAPRFDLRGDGLVDYADHIYWVEELAGTSFGDGPSLRFCSVCSSPFHARIGGNRSRAGLSDKKTDLDTKSGFRRQWLVRELDAR